MCHNISNYVPRMDFFLGTSPEVVDEEIPGISELSDGIKTAKARVRHLAVPTVNTWEAKQRTLIVLQEKLKSKM